MDNFSVPKPMSSPDGAGLPLGPSVTLLPEPEDNLPPSPPDVEGEPDSTALADDDETLDAPFETAELAEIVPAWLSPALGFAVGAAAGLALALAVNRKVRTRA